MINTRTDLALEAFDGQDRSSFPGVDVKRWETGDIQLTEVIISDADASEALNKPAGRYLTMDEKAGPGRQKRHGVAAVGGACAAAAGT